MVRLWYETFLFALLSFYVAGCDNSSTRKTAPYLQDFLFDELWPVSVSPNGKLLLLKRRTADGFEVQVRDRYSSQVLLKDISDRSQLSLTWSPDSSALVFQESRRKERVFDLYLIRLSHEKRLRLPVEPSRTALPPVRWSPDGRCLAYYSGGQKQGSLSTYCFDPTDRRNFQYIVAISPLADFSWARSGQAIATVAREALSSIFIYRFDTQEAETKKIFERGVVGRLDWSSRNGVIRFSARQSGQEYFSMWSYSPKVNKSLRAHRPKKGDVTFLHGSRNGRDFGYIIRSGCRNSILHVARGRVRSRPLIVNRSGAARNVFFDLGGSEVAFLFAGFRSPTQLKSYHVATRQIADVYKASTRSIIDPPMHVIDITSNDGLTIPAFFWEPEGGSGSNPWAIVRVHGGVQECEEPVWSPFHHALLKRDYKILMPNYRGTDGFGVRHASDNNFQGKVSDVIAAFDFLHHQNNIPYQHMIGFAESSGGALLLAAATQMQKQIGGAIMVGASLSHIQLHQIRSLPIRVVSFFGAAEPQAMIDGTKFVLEKLYGGDSSNRWQIVRLPNEGHVLHSPLSWAKVLEAIETMRKASYVASE